MAWVRCPEAPDSVAGVFEGWGSRRERVGFGTLNRDRDGFPAPLGRNGSSPGNCQGRNCHRPSCSRLSAGNHTAMVLLRRYIPSTSPADRCRNNNRNVDTPSMKRSRGKVRPNRTGPNAAPEFVLPIEGPRDGRRRPRVFPARRFGPACRERTIWNDNSLVWSGSSWAPLFKSHEKHFQRIKHVVNGREVLRPDPAAAGISVGAKMEEVQTRNGLCSQGDETKHALKG